MNQTPYRPPGEAVPPIPPGEPARPGGDGAGAGAAAGFGLPVAIALIMGSIIGVGIFNAGGALLLGIPVYAGQRGKMTEPAPVPEYR